MKKTLKKTYKAWMRFVYFLGEINAFIILTLFFIFVVGGYAVALRIIKLFRPPLCVSWLSKPYREPTITDLKKQF